MPLVLCIIKADTLQCYFCLRSLHPSHQEGFSSGHSRAASQISAKAGVDGGAQ